jgi:hypothetical protein
MHPLDELKHAAADFLTKLTDYLTDVEERLRMQPASAPSEESSSGTED